MGKGQFISYAVGGGMGGIVTIMVIMGTVLSVLLAIEACRHKGITLQVYVVYQG